MTHTYKVTGMTCEGCEAKVINLLGKVKGVRQVTVNRSQDEATVEMDHHVHTSALADALKDYPKYKLMEASHDKARMPVIMDEPKSWFETYKPLMMIFTYISLISLLSSVHDGQLSPMDWMNNFMAGFFLAFSFFKLLDLNGFADSYAMYDIVAKRVRVYGYIYPFLELFLGIAFLTRFNPVFTNWATIIIMGISIVGVTQSVLDKKKIRCACLGAVFNLPMSTVTIIEDLLMILMAAAYLLV